MIFGVYEAIFVCFYHFWNDYRNDYVQNATHQGCNSNTVTTLAIV